MNITYLEEDYNFDYSSEPIQNLIEKINDGSTNDTPLEFALKAYYYIRDGWPYYTYRISFIESDWRASQICMREKGNCLDKAILFISVLRAKHIPARFGLAKVKNHIAVDDIIEKLGKDVLIHGYAELYLNEKWVKVTPAFNKSLCEKLHVDPLDFDGINDCLFQAYNSSGTTEFMEYIEDYGTFNNLPLAYMFQLTKKTYPAIRKYIKLGSVLKVDEL